MNKANPSLRGGFYTKTWEGVILHETIEIVSATSTLHFIPPKIFKTQESTQSQIFKADEFYPARPSYA